MSTKETGQLSFGFAPNSKEQETRVDRLITFSQIEKIIYRKICQVEPEYNINTSAAIGSAIDWFLVPANFIYRYRGNYCFDPELYPEWNLKDVFARFYPTGFDFGKFLEILEKHRKNFIQNNPLYPANLALERKRIKARLMPVWQDVAKEFSLDALNLQKVMQVQNGKLTDSEKTASQETILAIGQRIVAERFDTLVDDDKNYSYCAKPDCLLVYELDGKTFNIQVQPDYIKRLRQKRKSVKKRNIVVKRIIGDFKDSDKKDLVNTETPLGKSMLVYSLLLVQIGEKFKWNQLTQIRLPTGQKRRVFLIPQHVENLIPTAEVQTALEFLQEKEGQTFVLMPKISPERAALAKNILEDALRISQEVKI